MPETVGEYADRICTVEMRPGKANLPRGVIHRLYDVARRKYGKPLTYLAARMLLDNVKPSDHLFIVTGAGAPPLLPVAEVDGYLGAVAIARAMILGRQAKPVLIADEWGFVPLQATCRGAEISLARAGVEPPPLPAVFEPLPIDHDACRQRAAALLDKYRPKVVLAIERLSPNSKGFIHGATGINYDDVHAKAHHLFDMAKERGIPTIGIGDGGNEIGFGAIHAAVREIMPQGAKCQCPCGGGSAARVATDLLVVAAISDWGGYGVATNIAFQLERPKVGVTAGVVERMLRNCVEAGAMDGVFARPIYSDDGVPLGANRACAEMLSTLVDIALSEVDSPGH